MLVSQARMLASSSALSLLLAVSAGCGDDDGDRAFDAATPRVDAAILLSDAGTSDAGHARADAGPAREDGGALADASVVSDSGRSDAGIGTDAGGDAGRATDAGPGVDAGSGDAGAAVKVVFVTSIAYSGDLGNLAGANELCQRQAGAASLARASSFKAFLSTNVTSAASNITHHASVPYVRTDGVVVANDWSDLVDGSLRAPIDHDELGHASTLAHAWCNTTIAGVAASSGDSCANYTASTGAFVGRVGTPSLTTSGWMDDSGQPCDAVFPIYCIED